MLLKMSVDAISFSAHADFDQTSKFLDLLRPSNVVLVHGEGNEMARLRKALERQGTAAGIEWTVHTPKVAQAVDVSFASSPCDLFTGQHFCWCQTPNAHAVFLDVQQVL